MKYFKKTVSLLLATVMVLALAGCGDSSSSSSGSSSASSSSSAESGSNSTAPASLKSDKTREIQIGSWYDQYYTSDHHSVDDNPNVQNYDIAEMQLNNMRAVEQKYNIELRYNNLTWTGCIESINTSIMAGTPDCQVYLTDLQFGIPAVIAGYATALEDILNSDIIEERYKDVLSGNSVVMKSLCLQPGVAKTYLFSANAVNLTAYPLGYNRDLIKKYGLEDPRELAAKGEWNWDKWMSMMKELTKDTNNDGTNDFWGFRGPWTTLYDSLLMSNGAHVVSPIVGEDGKVHEMLSSKETGEVLNFLHEMYQEAKVSFWTAECDSDWNSNVYAWAEGNIGFWVDQAWIAQEADKDQAMMNVSNPSESAREVVTWPIGPSGNADTNAQFNQTKGSYYIIPAGVENPQQIYCVMYDYFNWYADDTNLRDDDEWFREWNYNEENFEVLKGMADEAKDYTMDLWDQVKYDESFQVRGIIETGTGPDVQAIDVSSFVQANKQIVQDYCDTLFN